MSHHDHSHQEEKKSVNFWGPVIFGLVIWFIALTIETNLDEKDHHSENTHSTEQVESSHH